MTVSMIRVRINVTTDVIATAASVDNESSWSMIHDNVKCNYNSIL